MGADQAPEAPGREMRFISNNSTHAVRDYNRALLAPELQLTDVGAGAA